MALPQSKETERTVFLRDIVHATASQDVMGWPKPTEEDLALFGRIIQFYCGIDFALRYTLDVMDRGGMLASPWAGKTAKLNMYKTAQALRSSPIWNEGHRFAFDAIEEHRRVRNLVAHFVARRFVSEDAYIFVTMSAADFEQVYGVQPDADNMLFGVTDAAQMRGIIPELQALASWCSKLPGDLSGAKIR
ncbi:MULTISPECIES: hypothetical protein [unclassified Bradyrhizobium]|uniref:hypothetical protein n=1 Tax=unclassified Bradyrhizobium TaxID=2631580 RepID=UPI0023061C99|nr:MULTISPECIES: hypothetical protein [unclassified Bradyrhizobium]MDA9453723.1 hypothetical protein [Bradyrhizobium sp. CCBAU 21359]